jgi:hypothetical protein
MDWDYELYRHHGPFGLPFHFWTFFAFLFGITAGSFLNVVIHRMPLGQSVVHPPSHCPKCGQRIRLLQNLPILSWLLLRGKCSGCSQRISPRYIAVETLTGLLFVAAWIHYGAESPGAAIGAAANTQLGTDACATAACAASKADAAAAASMENRASLPSEASTSLPSGSARSARRSAQP